MKKRTKRSYANLFDNPTTLFEGVEVILFPNGEREILIRDTERGHAMRVKASVGPAGLSLRVSRVTLGMPLSVGGNRASDYAVARIDDDMAELEITQYNGDAASQAFKRWYRATPEERKALGIQHPEATDKPKCGGVVS